MMLPKPNYPTIAKQIRLSGQVNVQVLIDETGRVVSAQAIKGHPSFAERGQGRISAALLAQLWSVTSVKVSGIISYNFVLE